MKINSEDEIEIMARGVKSRDNAFDGWWK